MIYIIEDDMYVRRGLEFLFESAAMKYTSYDSGKAFLECLPIIENDIIILDMHIPAMNGCELLAYLASREMYYPVIVVTAYDEPATRECAKNYGAIAYLRKPFDSEALIDLVRYAVNPI